ncbi:hypothetical protein Rsub_07519 [Raphidocelis subcapitata]|uniref:Uncharacterized protein n=1 Tax=Raphidocelis subcapitata TaxID=307507 RepID=A0A2V0P580_9CHLO|nr:hypothetical protein Rsub_07519 [Raphidocelis subcapitata]|eukprot:GBF95018.1 hypothetical protein Rsub_07519 [Raphidocelis subcapitata]
MEPETWAGGGNGAAPEPEASAAPAAPPPPAKPTARDGQRHMDAICAALSFHRDQGLAWMPECMDDYLRTALQQAAHSGGDRSDQPTLPAALQPPQHQQQQQQQQQQADGAHIVALGSAEHAKGSGARAARWVVQIGVLVGSPALLPAGAISSEEAALAAEAAGDAGAAAACRVLSIQDGRPAAVGRAVTLALSRGEWARYGLKLAALSPGDDGDVTGTARLEELPGIPRVPVALLVASRTLFWNPPDPDTAALGARRRAAPRAPELAPKTEAGLFGKALAAALSDLRGQLPRGYLQSRAQARVAACLPPVARCIATIARNATNPGLLPYACTLLACQPAGLEVRLLAAMEGAADAALCAQQPEGGGGGGAGRGGSRGGGGGRGGAGRGGGGGGGPETAEGGEEGDSGGVGQRAAPALENGAEWAACEDGSLQSGGPSPRQPSKRPRRGRGGAGGGAGPALGDGSPSDGLWGDEEFCGGGDGSDGGSSDGGSSDGGSSGDGGGGGTQPPEDGDPGCDHDWAAGAGADGAAAQGVEAGMGSGGGDEDASLLF